MFITQIRILKFKEFRTDWVRMNRSKETLQGNIGGGGGGSTMRMVGVWLRQQQYRHVEQANFDSIKYVRSNNNIPSMLATTYRPQQKICIAFKS